MQEKYNAKALQNNAIIWILVVVQVNLKQWLINGQATQLMYIEIIGGKK